VLEGLQWWLVNAIRRSVLAFMSLSGSIQDIFNLIRRILHMLVASLGRDSIMPVSMPHLAPVVVVWSTVLAELFVRINALLKPFDFILLILL